MSAHLQLLFVCSFCFVFWAAEAQEDRRKNIWTEPVVFNTKARDRCTMIVTGEQERTKLRVSCQGPRRSYWCEYIGNPRSCTSFNKNPRHYFVQMMWGLRKLQNACLAPRTIKPHMCRKATDESQMVFSAASFPRQPERQKEVSQGRVQQRPVPPQSRPDWDRQPARGPVRGPIREPQRSDSGPQPHPTPDSHKRRLARQYCWKSLHGVCTFVFGWFRD